MYRHVYRQNSTSTRCTMDLPFAQLPSVSRSVHGPAPTSPTSRVKVSCCRRQWPPTALAATPLHRRKVGAYYMSANPSPRAPPASLFPLLPSLRTLLLLPACSSCRPKPSRPPTSLWRRAAFAQRRTQPAVGSGDGGADTSLTSRLGCTLALAPSRG